MHDASLAFAQTQTCQGLEASLSQGPLPLSDSRTAARLQLVPAASDPSLPDGAEDEASSRAAMLAQIPSLRRYARVLTRQADGADELVQECLLQALSRLHQWRRGSNMRPWLFSIMHNLHVNGLRRNKLRGTSAVDASEIDAAVEARQEDQAQVAAVFEALRQLPEEQQQVLRLVVIDDLSYRETAERLGVPIGTVMSRLARGRERLRALLGQP